MLIEKPGEALSTVPRYELIGKGSKIRSQEIIKRKIKKYLLEIQ
jgi:hypothetical protein